MGWRIPMVDLESEYADVGDALEGSVLRVLRSHRFVLGPECEALERELADRVGAGFAVTVASGSDALTLSLQALGIGVGHEVVIPAFSHFATAEAVIRTGARPVFADIEPDSFNLDPVTLSGVLTDRTRAVMPVHLFGRCADMLAIRAVVSERKLPIVAAPAQALGPAPAAPAAGARGRAGVSTSSPPTSRSAPAAEVGRVGAVGSERMLPIVEGAAQAVGAARDGRGAGAWGEAGCFSVYPSKNLGAAGDGGCITTSDPALAERLRLLRSHGTTRDGSHVLLGTTSRLDAIQAALLRSKLPYLKGWTEARVRNARVYAEELADCPGVEVPQSPQGETVAWNQFTLRCRQPTPIRAALEEAGIESRHYYPRPVCCEPGLGGLRRDAADFPNAARACAEAVSIPVRGSCSVETIREIAGVVRRAASARSRG